MDIAWISVAALVIVVIVSCTTKLNPGILAVVFAWILGGYLSKALKLKDVIAGFPADLFLTLSGVMLLFAIAQTNGTLDQAARAAVRLCRGNAGWIPVAFFSLTLVLASIGAGSIAAVALIAPVAMTVAGRAGIPAFLICLMVAHGGVAGGMTPFAFTGLVSKVQMERIGLPGMEWKIFLFNLAANVAVALAGYLIFGGWRLFRRPAVAAADESPAAFERRHALTLVVVGLLVVATTAFKVHVGMAGFAGATLLLLLRAGNDQEAFKAIPWPVIFMVCGVTVLTAVLEKTGGIDRITATIARISTPRTAPGILGFFTGVTSVYSSTSGVVLPAFLPTVPGLSAKLGGASPVGLASSIAIGANLVDVSPLSTLGALCIAAAPAGEDRRVLFNKVLAWGLSMAVLAGILCLVFFGLAANSTAPQLP